MMSDYQEELTAYLTTFIEELAGNGVDEVVISPGSRSTPLALLFAHHPKINVYINVDERSAAFFALGIAKTKRKPVALLCTSGTAAANYYPAIIEAKYSKVPLIVLTADRPHELREVGAPQAIDQLNLYGKHVKWSVDMALPESSPSLLRYARSAAVRGIGIAAGNPKGPVHFNFPFREPLIPNLTDDLFSKSDDDSKSMQKDVKHGKKELPLPLIASLQDVLSKKQKGLIVCGPNLSPEAISEIVTFSDQWGFPIIADSLSQLRSGDHDQKHVIDTYDTFLRIEEVKAELQPDIIIRFGAMPVSKALTLYMKDLHEKDHWIVTPDEDWIDPNAQVTEMIYCDERAFCQAFLNGGVNRDSNWLEKWKLINEQTKKHMETPEDELDEGNAVRYFLQTLPNNASVFVSNSMPIRDVDTYFHNNQQQISIMANRGVNGIDGVVSTALGMSTATKPSYLIIGDLAFFHDLNGLLVGKKYNLDLTIFVLNNNGGGIFSYLPQSSEETYFELLFGTPMDLDFAHAANLYGAKYSKVTSMDELQICLEEGRQVAGLKIVEVMTDRDVNAANHRKMWNFVSQEIVELLKGTKNDHNS
jgi:2-succinyl-5-enolpyruvyl-6-hydroxy-3-cyclohexene-1-carboxylate synthase